MARLYAAEHIKLTNQVPDLGVLDLVLTGYEKAIVRHKTGEDIVITGEDASTLAALADQITKRNAEDETKQER